MTEAEWLTCTEPQNMMEFLGRKASNRKLRLFACGCCRRIWNLLSDVRSKRAVDLAEAFADELADQSSLESVTADLALIPNRYYGTFGLIMREILHQPVEQEGVEALLDVLLDHDEWATGAILASYCAVVSPSLAPEVAVTTAAMARARPQFAEMLRAERVSQSVMIRDIFCNPFRPISSHPSWLTHTVISLAQGIYKDQAFDRLPILADALEEAGCTTAEILDHCRQPGPHVRGCWVVDLLLDRR